MGRPKEDPRKSYKRVLLIELPEPRNQDIPEMVRLFANEQSIFRVIIAGAEHKHIVFSAYNYYPRDEDDVEYERLYSIARAFLFPKKDG